MALAKKMSLESSEEGLLIIAELKRMASDVVYHTDASYSANMQYTDNLIPFVDKHVKYLNDHKNVDPKQYLSNLRLMTKRR